MEFTPEVINAIVDSGIRSFRLDMVHLTLRRGELDIDRMVERIEDTHDDDSDCNIEGAKKIIQTLKWDTVLFPSVSELIVKNMNPCDDHTEYDEPFVWKTATPSGVTVIDLVEAVFRVKAQKTNYWNELFCELSQISLENGCLEYEVEFDYGS
jgi:hypothetical protein